MPPDLLGRKPFLYLVSTLLPERRQGRRDHTADAISTLGAHKAEVARLFLQEHGI